MEIVSGFVNGILNIKNNGYGFQLYGKKFEVRRINLYKSAKIKRSCSVFKTVGICILTDKEQNPKDFEKWYSTPDKDLERFNKVLEERMNEKYEKIKGERLDTEIKFTPINEKELEVFIRQGKISPSFTSPIKTVYVKHYGGFVKGFKGVFYLESHPKMLQFIYDYVLGVRTGQGFGMLELITQI